MQPAQERTIIPGLIPPLTRLCTAKIESPWAPRSTNKTQPITPYKEYSALASRSAWHVATDAKAFSGNKGKVHVVLAT